MQWENVLAPAEEKKLGLPRRGSMLKRAVSGGMLPLPARQPKLLIVADHDEAASEARQLSSYGSTLQMDGVIATASCAVDDIE